MPKQVIVERLDASVLPELRINFKAKPPRKKNFATDFPLKYTHRYGPQPESEVQEALENEWKVIQGRRKRLSILSKKSFLSPVYLDSTLIDDLGLRSMTEHSDWRGFQYYAFGDVVFGVRGPYSDSEFKLFVLEEAGRERRYFERVSQRHAKHEAKSVVTSRDRIPERVRTAVWRRDQGQCSRCRSRERLEFDHIIPVSEGGHNTERNIELLCEKCNRTKGRGIS